jgi:hypothetical protein
MTLSPLQIARYKYEPKLPPVLKEDLSNVEIKMGAETQAVSDVEELKNSSLLPLGSPSPVLLREAAQPAQRL